MTPPTGWLFNKKRTKPIKRTRTPEREREPPRAPFSTGPLFRLWLCSDHRLRDRRACAQGPLRAEPDSLERATPKLIQDLRADPYDYFRFVNRPWVTRVCNAFSAEIPNLPVVHLHGDPHVEQFAFTNKAWGLDDFDDSAPVPP